MKILIVYAHPEARSFNGAMLRCALDTFEEIGDEVQVSDLYASKFDPVGGRHDFTTVKNAAFFKYAAEQVYANQHEGFAADVAAEQQRLLWCDLVVFQFPLWWFSVPAILKGWFDRVLAMGFAYGGGRWFEHGPLRPRRAMLAMTAGAPRERYLEANVFGAIEHVLYPIHVGVLNLVGLDVLEPFIAWAAARVAPETRAQYLVDYARRLRNIADEAPLPMRTIADHPDPYAGRTLPGDVTR